MKIEITQEKDNKLNFKLSGSEVSVANAIRRYAMNAIPIFAIDEVTFYDNTSVFFNEYIAQRIGLIPIITPSDVQKDTEVTFYLDASGPKVVYSSELETKDKKIKVAKDKIPIITLLDNQILRVEGKARLATAKKHAKFQAGFAAYEITEDGCNFTVESFFQMPPRELMIRAATILVEDLKNFENQLNKIKKT